MEKIQFDIDTIDWVEEHFENFFNWINDLSGVSDINFISGEPVWIRLFGHWTPVTDRIISFESLRGFINNIYDQSGSAQIISGVYIDFNYDHKLHVRGQQKLRFRCNATGCKSKSGDANGISLIMRLIPKEPPSLAELDIEPEIIAACKPKNGLVLLSGVMGSGKSTTNSAILKDIIIDGGRFVVTYEDPIEFDLMNIEGAKSPVTQSEIKKHLKDFNEVCRNVSRRAADVMLVGESRDLETLSGMLTAAEMGMAVYTTVHTRTVAEIFSRIVTVFPSHEWNMISSLLIRSIHLGIQQRLLPTVDGKRIAIREYMIFTEDHKKELLNLSIQEVAQKVKEMVKSDGVTLQKAAQKKYEEGIISKEIYQTILDEDKRRK